MGYLETQNAAWRATIADGVAGNGLKRAIKALQEKSQIKDSLANARKRGAITAKRKTAKRTAGTTADRTEVSRAYYSTTRTVTSSDGLLVWQYRNLYSVTFDSGGTDRYADYVPS
jgi:hypothetical protein